MTRGYLALSSPGGAPRGQQALGREGGEGSREVLSDLNVKKVAPQFSPCCLRGSGSAVLARPAAGAKWRLSSSTRAEAHPQSPFSTLSGGSGHGATTESQLGVCSFAQHLLVPATRWACAKRPGCTEGAELSPQGAALHGTSVREGG